MPIRVLDAATVGRIAAGEVVERPSSVVKELMENAIDAGATSITVEIKGGGIDYLRVTDNGCGIEPSQVRLAFENHATSKLQRAEQLDDIRTLGFRGEALPSIAAVSRVEMTTRAKNQEIGMKYTGEGGANIQLRECGCPQGTTMIMRDLFFNVPVRRAFLKKPAYEGGLVSDAVSRMLLGNTGVSVRFISGGNQLFHSFGDGNLRHAVFAVYGRETAEKMADVDAFEGGIRIRGLIGTGELAKATRAHQLFFINGRSVRCPLLTRVLEEVCRSRVTIGMYPMCVLNLSLPVASVDVNVHPNKLEVRFRDAETVRSACIRLLNTAFEGERVLEIQKITAAAPQIEKKVSLREIPLPTAEDTAKDAKCEAAGTPKNAAPVCHDEAPKPVDLKPAAPKATLEKPEQLRLDIRDRAPSAVLREDRASIIAEPKSVLHYDALNVKSGVKEKAEWPNKSEGTVQNTQNQSVAKAETPALVSQGADTVQAAQEAECEADIPPFRLIGVVFKTYILVETGDSLLMIDQHAAHERLQYEKLMKMAEAGRASQQLLTPLVIHVSAKELALIEENMESLREAGYEVEPFGDSDIQVRAVPFIMGKAEIRPLFLETIQSLGRLKTAAIDARRASIMQMACKSAVKAGNQLSESEIRTLIADMLKTGAPPTCPHGRPVAKALSKHEIEKMFKRIQ